MPLMPRLTARWLTLLTHAGALVPLALLLWDASQDRLTANPIQAITQRTGYPALVLLVLSLACTPANTVLGLKAVLPLRRPLGLYAFFYASLHLLIFVGLDFGFDWGLIWQGVVEKRFVVAGFAAFLLLLPLALTSTRGWMRRLGRRWKHLHRLVYLAAPLAVVHYLWLVKADIRAPLAFGAVVTVLLTLRLPLVRRAISAARARWARSPLVTGRAASATPTPTTHQGGRPPSAARTRQSAIPRPALRSERQGPGGTLDAGRPLQLGDHTENAEANAPGAAVGLDAQERTERASRR